MKELSIEEKAKAYDEAKLRMSKAFNDNRCSIGFMNEIFPELAESEDERIKKTLIHIVKGACDKYGIKYQGKEISEEKLLDWIEKQGNLVKYYEDKLDRCACENFNKGYKKALEKQGEQKPTEWNPQPGDTFRKKGTISPTYHLCNKREDGITFSFVENNEVSISGGEITIFALRNDYELVERLKPIEKVVEEEFNKVICPNNAWSEEDESMLKTIFDSLNTYAENGHPCLKSVVKDEIDWLKSIKERMKGEYYD